MKKTRNYKLKYSTDKKNSYLSQFITRNAQKYILFCYHLGINKDKYLIKSKKEDEKSVGDISAHFSVNLSHCQQPESTFDAKQMVGI